MPEFQFQEMFPHGPDTTPYRKLTGDFVSVDEHRGRPILHVDGQALDMLADRALRDVSHPGHGNSLVRGLVI